MNLELRKVQIKDIVFDTEMKIIDGRLDVRRIAVGRNDAASVTADGRKIGFSRADGALELDADIPVASSLEVRFGTP